MMTFYNYFLVSCLFLFTYDIIIIIIIIIFSIIIRVITEKKSLKENLLRIS